uniref:Uncharacterized protein n=1 Tax=Fagus sylvatica TaxID=28930 RepID=A0A2N9IVC7_FAGSY
MATTSPTSSPSSSLFATIDMGTNSFKLLIVKANPSGQFITLNNHKHPVLLGLNNSNPTTPFAISNQSYLLALQTLQNFQSLLLSHQVTPTHTRCVATAAIREATNGGELVECVKEKIGLEVEVLSGEEEARLVYLGALQSLPVYDKLVLVIDIGGGSTEFVVGKEGKVCFGASLKLGHVSLTEKFVKNGLVGDMREFIRLVIQESGVVERIKEFGVENLEMVVGCSGTIRAVEKAVFYGYAKVVERLCDDGGGKREKVRRDRFFKRRSEFIVAGAVLLEEIFEVVGIEKMEVSGYALGEGVIAESLSKVYGGYNLNANVRWRSVMQLAMRFNSKKSMRIAAQCAGIAKVIFEGLRKCEEVAASLDERDLEFLEAACLLHSVGLFIGKKGYHKQTYRIIMDGGHLHGYSTEEVKLMALLTRHHRKKFPKSDHASLKAFSEEVKQKFRSLCAILRISVALQQHQCINVQEMAFSLSREGFKLEIGDFKDQNQLPTIAQPLAADTVIELGQELENFKKVYHQDLSVVVHSSTSESLQ